MKKIIYILILATGSFVSCKPKSDLDSKKEIVSLSDSAFYNSSYLTDTGAVADPEEFMNSGAVISGKATVPERNNNASGTSTKKDNGSYGSSSGSGAGTGANTSTSSTSTKKKGISKAAKGAIIGGVGGAVAGGVIGKNAKGAGIGAVIGAAGGYIIGRSKDKKDGRVGN